MLDASNYEGAALIHDMNQPIPDTLRERFSVVFDGGTLEHVFNVTQALKNCMEMVAVGGHFIQVNTANNYMGHGFWQFSPELIYRRFRPGQWLPRRGRAFGQLGPGGAWYIAPDPEQVRMRVELCNSWPTYILTLARRVAIAEIFAQSPQQSDYVAMWKGEGDAHPPRPQRSARLRRFLPISVKRAVRDLLEPLGVFEKTQGFYQPYYRRVSESYLLLGKLN